MPHRYRFKVEYFGPAFHGWQKQPHQHTVQEELEKAFRTFTGNDLSVWGSGRTDAGVHASGQVAIVDSQKPIDTFKAAKAINGISNSNVFIRDFEECSTKFSPRYDAQYRYYQYRVLTRPSSIYKDIAWHPKYHVDPDLVQQEAKSFLGEHDFIKFCIPRNDGKSTLCTLSQFDLTGTDNGFILHIKGNRFLHKMVRCMVGLLIDVGRGKLPPGTVQNIFEEKYTGEWTWAPPTGLVLYEVKYKDY